MPRVFVAAGSNVEPERNLAKAVAALAQEFPDLELSPWYRNKAVGFEGDDFINFVFGFSTELSVQDVRIMLKRSVVRGAGPTCRGRTSVGAAASAW